MSKPFNKHLERRKRGVFSKDAWCCPFYENESAPLLGITNKGF